MKKHLVFLLFAVLAAATLASCTKNADNTWTYNWTNLPAKEAGKIMLSASDISPETDEKQGHANFVTSYDRRIQEYLFKALHELVVFIYLIHQCWQSTDRFSPL